MFKNIDDLRIKSIRPLISPAILLEELPATGAAAQVVANARQAATKIVRGRDDRLVVVVGPCSIHDPKAALEYASKLIGQAEQLQEDLLIIMRVYFEKPRTIVGWKGLINDPKLDDSFDINQGLHIARGLLLNIANLGLPTGTEFLDTVIPQFISDLISWGAIGARTTESQIHRELASGLSMPIGFKNGTSGDVQIAIDAIRSAKHPHHFLGVTKQGLPAIIATTGNDACHVILRGSNSGTNYNETNIVAVAKALRTATLPPRIMVDCSHGNSGKDPAKQALVIKAVCEQVSSGSKFIAGVMLESFLIAGKQTLHQDKPLTYGQSITDGCISWKETEVLLKNLAEAVRKRRWKKS